MEKTLLKTCDKVTQAIRISFVHQAAAPHGLQRWWAFWDACSLKSPSRWLWRKWYCGENGVSKQALERIVMDSLEISSSTNEKTRIW
jgi:hypothetical protein